MPALPSPMSDAPYTTAPPPLRHVRWTVVLGALIAAYLVGIGGGLACRSLGWWADGGAWERAVLGWVHGTVTPWLDPLFLVVPLFGTNYSLVPVVAFAALWLWRPPGRLGTLALALLGSIILAGAAQAVAVFVLHGSVPRPVLSTLGVAGAGAAWALDRRWSGRSRHPVAAGHLAVAQLGSWVLNPALKLSLRRPRPELFPQRGQHGMSAYPSGHAIAVTAVLFTAAYLVHRSGRGWWGWWVAGALVLLTAYSRVYLAVHWPTDVVGGVAVGAVWLLGVLVAFRPAHAAGDA